MMIFVSVMHSLFAGSTRGGDFFYFSVLYLMIFLEIMRDLSFFSMEKLCTLFLSLKQFSGGFPHATGLAFVFSSVFFHQTQQRLSQGIFLPLFFVPISSKKMYDDPQQGC